MRSRKEIFVFLENEENTFYWMGSEQLGFGCRLVADGLHLRLSFFTFTFIFILSLIYNINLIVYKINNLL